MDEIGTNFLFFLPVITGFILFIAALLLKKFPPRKINRFYGYRTPASRKSQAHWNFAQIYAGRELLRISLIMIALGFLGLFAKTDIRLGALIGGSIIVILTVYLIFRIEVAIRKKFND